MSKSLGGFLQRLFGAGTADTHEAAADEAIDYKGYRIIAAPRNEGGQWIVAGTILRDGPEGEQRYTFVRADSYGSRDGAAEFTVIKARQIIDLEGEAIFDKADAT